MLLINGGNGGNPYSMCDGFHRCKFNDVVLVLTFDLIFAGVGVSTLNVKMTLSVAHMYEHGCLFVVNALSIFPEGTPEGPYLLMYLCGKCILSPANFHCRVA